MLSGFENCLVYIKKKSCCWVLYKYPPLDNKDWSYLGYHRIKAVMYLTMQILFMIVEHLWGLNQWKRQGFPILPQKIGAKNIRNWKNFLKVPVFYSMRKFVLVTTNALKGYRGFIWQSTTTCHHLLPVGTINSVFQLICATLILSDSSVTFSSCRHLFPECVYLGIVPRLQRTLTTNSYEIYVYKNEFKKKKIERCFLPFSAAWCRKFLPQICMIFYVSFIYFIVTFIIWSKRTYMYYRKLIHSRCNRCSFIFVSFYLS